MTNFVIRDLGDDISTKSCSENDGSQIEKFTLNINNLETGKTTILENLDLELIKGNQNSQVINMPKIIEKVVKKYDIPKFLKHKKKLIKTKLKIEDQQKYNNSSQKSNLIEDDDSSPLNNNLCCSNKTNKKNNNNKINQYQQQTFQKFLQEPDYILKNKNIQVFDEISQKFINLGQEPYLNMHIPFIKQQFQNEQGIQIYVQVSQTQITSSFSIYPQIDYECFIKTEQTENQMENEKQIEESIQNKSEKKQKKNSQNNKQIIDYILQDDIQSDNFCEKLSDKLKFLKYCQLVQLKPKKKMKNEKRIKERTIKDVKEKVYQWRNIAIDNNISLEKAAEIIGISRKTLDDYCLQIRKGKECGFDYVKNKNAKMGELRQFVKENSHVKNMGILDIKGQDTTQVNSNFEKVPISNNYSHTTNIQQDDIGQFFSNNCQENQDKFQQPYLIRVETSMDYTNLEKNNDFNISNEDESDKHQNQDQEIEIILKQIEDNKNRKYKKSRKTSYNTKSRKNSSKKMSLCEFDKIEKKIKSENSLKENDENTAFQIQNNNQLKLNYPQENKQEIKNEEISSFHNLEENGTFSINNLFGNNFNTTTNNNNININNNNINLSLSFNNNNNSNNKFIIQQTGQNVNNNVNSNNILSNSINFMTVNNYNTLNQNQEGQFQLQSSFNQKNYLNLDQSYQLNFN